MAVKKISKRDLIEKELILLKQEIEINFILSELGQQMKNFARTIDFIEDDQSVTLVLEYVQGQPLLQWLMEQSSLR